MKLALKKSSQASRPALTRGRGRPNVAQPKASVTLRIDPQMIISLDELAHKMGIARSALIQLAVAQILKTGINLSA